MDFSLASLDLPFLPFIENLNAGVFLNFYQKSVYHYIIYCNLSYISAFNELFSQTEFFGFESCYQ